jgi:hypothetical protein
MSELRGRKKAKKEKEGREEREAREEPEERREERGGGRVEGEPTSASKPDPGGPQRINLSRGKSLKG